MTKLHLLHLVVKPIRQFKTGLTLVVLLSMALVLMLIAPSLPASRAAGSRTASARVRSAPKPRKSSCCGDVPAISRRMVGSYYNTDGNFNSTLTLNNKGPLNIEVTPILHNPNGNRFTASPVMVPGQSSYNVDLDALAASAGPSFKSGSFEFTFTGRLLEMGGGLRIVDATKSLIFDEQMLEPGMKFSSPQLEAIYAIPFDSAEVSVIVTNTTDQPLNVNGDATFLGENGHHPIHANLGPHAQQVVNLPHDLVKKADAGAVTISHNGGTGALLAMIHVKEASKGFSAAVNFFDPSHSKINKWHGAGLRLGIIGGEWLAPTIAVRNLGSSATTVTGHVPFTTTGGSAETIDLPATALAPGEFKLLNLSNPNFHRTDIATAGVEIEYTGAHGQVIASAFSSSLSGTQVFTVPIMEPPSAIASTGGYPWFIQGTNSTVVFIKNTTDQPQEYYYELVYPGGKWGGNLHKIAPHQTHAIDLRQLRDSQAVGTEGNTIPLGATVGFISWSVRGVNTRALIGRAQTVDPAAGTASSYMCAYGCTCPPDFYDSRLDTNSWNTVVDDTHQFTAQEQTINCFGGTSSFYNVTPNWSSDDTNVATINSSGFATTVGIGDIYLWGNWQSYTYDPHFGPCDVTNVYPSPFAETTVKPLITISITVFSPASVRNDGEHGATTASVDISASPAQTDGLQTGDFVVVEIIKNTSGGSFSYDPTSQTKNVTLSLGNSVNVSFGVTALVGTAATPYSFTIRVSDVRRPSGSSSTSILSTVTLNPSNGGMAGSLTVTN